MAKKPLDLDDEGKLEDKYALSDLVTDPRDVQVISSGSTLIDCVLGGGYALGRISNIVGDKSTNKTGSVIEVSANFYRTYPEGLIRYNEVESAFDLPYAEKLGFPVDKVELANEDQSMTVEDFYEDLLEFTKRAKEKNVPGLYLLDSLDALSDRSELERGIGDSTYGSQKAKKMSEVFRRLVRDLYNANVHLLIVSQVRDNIGVTFGEKHSRSGGRALDFYASQILWLAHLKQLTKQVRGVQKVIGIKVKAKCKKNKLVMPFRECEFDVIFGYGIDDAGSCLDWLKSVGALNGFYESFSLDEKNVKSLMAKRFVDPSDEYFDMLKNLQDYTRSIWNQIESKVTPVARKYR